MFEFLTFEIHIFQMMFSDGETTKTKVVDLDDSKTLQLKTSFFEFVLSTAKSELAAGTCSKPREIAWSRSRALPKLRRTPDRMVVT